MLMSGVAVLFALACVYLIVALRVALARKR